MEPTKAQQEKKKWAMECLLKAQKKHFPKKNILL